MTYRLTRGLAGALDGCFEDLGTIISLSAGNFARLGTYATALSHLVGVAATVDTGGLMQDRAPTIYAYPSLEALLKGEAAGGKKRGLPGPRQKPVTERQTTG